MTQTTLQILLSLSGGPLHGYGIKLDVAHRTSGDMILGSGTLYEAIQRLEERGWISPAPPEEDGTDPRRQYYCLTKAGKNAVRAELAHLESILAFGRSRNLDPRAEEA